MSKTIEKTVTEHTFLGDNPRRCAHWYCGQSIGHHLYTQAADAADENVIYVLGMEWSNTETYSEGEELSVHRSREDAVKEILSTVHSLGLEDGIAEDPAGNDPESSDEGTYWVDYQGKLSFRIQRCELPQLPTYNADNRCRICTAHIAEPHFPGCPISGEEL